ncbi:MAG: radical SAM family heme chaperone HemW [Deinococcota bacterium]
MPHQTMTVAPDDVFEAASPAPRALYVHVPFCPSICPYCDFHKMRRHEPLVKAYLARLAEEARERYDRYGGKLETIYLGGGTPSHLQDDELEHLISTLQTTWGTEVDEFTLEADPLTFDSARLNFFKTLGITRLSIGLQSTQNDVLKFLGRKHTATEGLEAVTMALEAGFRVSADLITAVDGQDTARDLHTLAHTGVGHISVYNLTIEPYTSFALRGVQVDEHKEADDYELANVVLEDYGFERYEVSSHARPAECSRHNQMYWHGAYFVALGPSAAGFIPTADVSLIGKRYTNPQIKHWLAGEAGEVLEITPLNFVQDMLMTGLRTTRGANLEALSERTQIDVVTTYKNLITTLVQKGLLSYQAPWLRATDAGILQLNPIVKAFFEAS